MKNRRRRSAVARMQSNPQPWDAAHRVPPTQQELERWIDELGLPHLPSFVTAEQFLEAIAAQRRRPITLLEVANMPASICGVWLATDTTDTIVVDDKLTGPRRDLVIMHEAAHVLFDHRSGDAHPGLGTQALYREIGDVDSVHTCLARSHYDDRQEWQAEWMATYFLSRTRRLRRGSWVSHPTSRYAARLINGHE